MKKVILILALCLCLCLCACMETELLKKASDSHVQSTENASTEITIENFGESEMFRQMVNVIHGAFVENSPSVEYDRINSLVNITVTAPQGTVDSLEQGSQQALESWQIITNSLLELSKSGYETLGGAGLRIGCAVILLSDENPENVLYATLNGAEFYDALD